MSGISMWVMRHKLYKFLAVGFAIVAIVLASALLPPATAKAGTPGACFTGKGYNNITNPEGNHNYVWFTVGTAYNGHASWSITPPPWSVYFRLFGYSMNRVPGSGIAQVYFRFAVLPYWVLPSASKWKICAQ